MPSLLSPRLSLLYSVLTIPPLIFALEVTPGSTCASACQDDTISGTNTTDIVCNDTDFFSTPTGTKFKNCVQCLQTSTSVDGSENDLAWFLYNLRYAIDVCLFEYPGKIQNWTASACTTELACNPLQSALQTGNLNANSTTEYQYCTADGSVFAGQTLASCVQCLQSTSNNIYLSNFLLALEAGCEQQPAPGTLLELGGGLFSQTALNITAPSNETTSSTTGSSSPLPLRDIIGISAGAGSLFLIGAVLFCVYCCRQRRFNKEDRMDALGVGLYRQGGPRSWSSATQQGPPGVFTMDYKQQAPSTSGSEQPESMGDFSTNADYYKQAAKAASQMSYGMLDQPADGAMPAHPAYIPRIAVPRKSAPPRSRIAQTVAAATTYTSTPEPDQQPAIEPARPRRKKTPPPQVFIPTEPQPVYQQAGNVSPVFTSSDTEVEARYNQGGKPTASGPSLTVAAPSASRAPRGQNKYRPPPPSYIAAAETAAAQGRSASAMSTTRNLTPPPPPGHRRRDSSASVSGSGGEAGTTRAFRDREREMSRDRATGTAAAPAGPDGNVVEQRVDRRRWQELPIGSGKSLLYG